MSFLLGLHDLGNSRGMQNTVELELGRSRSALTVPNIRKPDLSLLLNFYEFIWIRTDLQNPDPQETITIVFSNLQKDIRLSISPNRPLEHPIIWKDWLETSEKHSANANFPTTFLGFSEATFQHVNDIDSRASRLPNDSSRSHNSQVEQGLAGAFGLRVLGVVRNEYWIHKT